MITPSSRLHVVYVIDSLAVGGAERSLLALARPYRELGVDLDVVTIWNRPGLREQLEATGARVAALDRPGRRTTRPRQISRLLRDLKPDLVHTTLFESDVAGRIGARIAGVPVVTTLANDAYGPAHLGEQGALRTRVRSAQALDALTARIASRLHAVSEHVRSKMAPRLHYPMARIDVVPRGRDAAMLGRRTAERRASARRSLGADPDDDVVLAVARHEPQKNVDVLVRAMQLVRDARPRARLVVAGGKGRATPKIVAAVEATGLKQHVELLGERSDVADLLCAADVFVLTSEREGMPGSVIEAMAMEAPVVASDLPQIREVTCDAALLAPVGDVSLFATAIREALDDRVASARRVVRARARFESRFTIDQTSRMMVEFYGRALDPSVSGC